MPRRFSKSVQRRFDVLRLATRGPVCADLATRLGVAFLLIGIVVFGHWSDRAGLQDSYDGHVSFLDVVYFTMISVTTTGFGDITPVSDRSRLIEAVIVTPIRIAVLFIFIGTAYQFVLKRRSEEHTSELQSLMRISYAVFCLKKKTHNNHTKIVSHDDTT